MGVMSTAEQLDEAICEPVLLEASLSRIWHHHGKTGFGIVTAWRGRRPEAKNDAELLALNKKAVAELRADIKASGFGFIPVEGVGQEKRGGKIVQSPEPSFLVPNSKRGKPASPSELRDVIMRLGKKYEQDAVVIHDPETGTEIISPDGTVFNHAKSFSPNTIGEFFTRLRGSRTFRLEGLEWWGLRYGSPPGNWMEGMAMENEGRVGIAEFSDRLDEWMNEMGVGLGLLMPGAL